MSRNEIFLTYYFGETKDDEWEYEILITPEDISNYYLLDQSSVKKLFPFIDFDLFQKDDGFILYLKNKHEKDAKANYEWLK